MPGTSPVLSLRAKLLTTATEIFVGIEGEPPHVLIVSLLGITNERKTHLRLRAEPGEPATLIGYGARLDDDELAILRALADASEPLQSRGIARALNMEEECSTLRIRLGPRGNLRAGGYVNHEPNEGYFLTEKGRNAVESAGPL